MSLANVYAVELEPASYLKDFGGADVKLFLDIADAEHWCGIARRAQHESARVVTFRLVEVRPTDAR